MSIGKAFAEAHDFKMLVVQYPSFSQSVGPLCFLLLTDAPHRVLMANLVQAATRLVHVKTEQLVVLLMDLVLARLAGWLVKHPRGTLVHRFEFRQFAVTRQEYLPKERFTSLREGGWEVRERGWKVS